MHEDCMYSPFLADKALLEGVVKQELEELCKIKMKGGKQWGLSHSSLRGEMLKKHGRLKVIPCYGG